MHAGVLISSKSYRVPESAQPHIRGPVSRGRAQSNHDVPGSMRIQGGIWPRGFSLYYVLDL